MEDKEIFIDDYRISHVFNFPDPFVESILIKKLKENDYIVESESRVINAPPFRAVRTDIAKKEDISILYNNEVSFIGVAGKSFKDVKDNFLKLNEILKEIDSLMLSKVVDAEIIMRGRIWTNKDPQTSISNFMNIKNKNKFEEIFGKKVRTFSIRVVTEDMKIMDNPNWFSLRIEPLANNPRYYFIQFVYRNESLEDVLAIADKIDEILLKSIEVVEE